MKRIYPREEYCMNCRLCEINCLVAHSKSKNLVKAFKEEVPRSVSRIVFEQAGPVSFALQCRHCEEPYCVEACMTGAMTKDAATGRVVHDREKCVGCWMCLMVCPYGAIARDTDGKAASKCDLCPDEDVPVCVAACPNEALVYEERDRELDAEPAGARDSDR